jgi:hypothetical protein
MSAAPNFAPSWRKKRWWLLLTLAAVFFFLAAWWSRTKGLAPQPALVDSTIRQSSLPQRESGVSAPPALNGSSQTGNNLIAPWVAGLDRRSPQITQQRLGELLGMLRALPPSDAARHIIGFLDTGVDALTGMRFRVGPGGRLAATPSLRVALLDWLADFDPLAARAYSEKIYQSSDPDEWAVALRNHWRIVGSVEPAFVERVKAMFGREAWFQNPSGGFVESMDFAVAIGGADGWSILTGVLARGDGLRRVALAALDAWTIQDRSMAITQLVQPGQTPSPVDAQTRAALLARADVGDTTQKDHVRDYLLSPRIGREEKAEFLRQFPNQNMILGHRLVTTTRPTSWKGGAELDAVALRFVDDLIRAGAVQDIRVDLAASRERLQRFVESAQRGGHL